MLFCVNNSHDNWALLSPDALGGVLSLHIGRHSVLHGACDVLLDHIGTVVSVGTVKQHLTLIA